MKTFWKIAGIAALVAILGVAVVGAIAFAQAPEDGSGWPFDFRTRMHEAIANILGVSVEEYDTAVETAQGQVLDEAVTEGWLTEDQADRMRERMAEGAGPWMGQAARRWQAARFKAGRSFANIAADELDMTVQDLIAELREGKTITQLAEEKGVDPQAISDAFLTQLAEKLDEAVAEGRLTQKMADWMLSQAETRVTDMLDKTWEGHGPGGFRQGGGPGRFGGFAGQGDS